MKTTPKSKTDPLAIAWVLVVFALVLCAFAVAAHAQTIALAMTLH